MALVERALEGELTHHLGYPPHDVAGDNSGNSRNGKFKKTMTGQRGQVEIEVPRDRRAEFRAPVSPPGSTPLRRLRR